MPSGPGALSELILKISCLTYWTEGFLHSWWLSSSSITLGRHLRIEKSLWSLSWVNCFSKKEISLFSNCLVSFQPLSCIILNPLQIQPSFLRRHNWVKIFGVQITFFMTFDAGFCLQKNSSILYCLTNLAFASLRFILLISLLSNWHFSSMSATIFSFSLVLLKISPKQFLDHQDNCLQVFLSLRWNLHIGDPSTGIFHACLTTSWKSCSSTQRLRNLKYLAVTLVVEAIETRRGAWSDPVLTDMHMPCTCMCVEYEILKPGILLP